VLFAEHTDGMYFDEFIRLAREVTSELFLCIYDCIYQYVPCVKNFLILRRNYINFLQTTMADHRELKFKPYTYTILMPPVTRKMQERVIESVVSPIESPASLHQRKALQTTSRFAKLSPEKEESEKKLPLPRRQDL